MPGIEWVTPDGLPTDGTDALDESRQARISRRWLIFLTVLAVLLAAGGGVALATHDPSPKLTVTLLGARVDDAGTTIAVADKRFRAYVRANGGALTKQSRCYFARIAGQPTDVATTVFCAPTLFADGHLPAVFLSYDLTATHLANGHVTLTPKAQPTSEVPELPPLPALERPDRKQFTMPKNLSVPAAVTTQPGSLMTVDSDQLGADFNLTASGQMGAPDLLVALEGGQFIGQFGAGAGVRRPPAGSRLLAFGVTIISAKYDSFAGIPFSLGLQVDGGAVRALRQFIPHDSYTASANFVATVPQGASTIELVFDRAGFRQTLSLPNGRPGPNNLAVYSQPIRDENQEVDTSVSAQVEDSGATSSASLSLSVTGEHLEYYTDYNVTPSAHDKGFLHVDICYAVAGADDSTCTALPASVLTLRAGGRTYRARNIAPPDTDEYPVFEVPAYFGPAVLTVAGTFADNGVTITLTDPFRYALAMDAGG